MNWSDLKNTRRLYSALYIVIMNRTLAREIMLTCIPHWMESLEFFGPKLEEKHASRIISTLICILNLCLVESLRRKLDTNFVKRFVFWAMESLKYRNLNLVFDAAIGLVTAYKVDASLSSLSCLTSCIEALGHWQLSNEQEFPDTKPTIESLLKLIQILLSLLEHAKVPKETMISFLTISIQVYSGTTLSTYIQKNELLTRILNVWTCIAGVDATRDYLVDAGCLQVICSAQMSDELSDMYPEESALIMAKLTCIRATLQGSNIRAKVRRDISTNQSLGCVYQFVRLVIHSCYARVVNEEALNPLVLESSVEILVLILNQTSQPSYLDRPTPLYTETTLHILIQILTRPVDEALDLDLNPQVKFTPSVDLKRMCAKLLTIVPTHLIDPHLDKLYLGFPQPSQWPSASSLINQMTILFQRILSVQARASSRNQKLMTPLANDSLTASLIRQCLITHPNTNPSVQVFQIILSVRNYPDLFLNSSLSMCYCCPSLVISKALCMPFENAYVESSVTTSFEILDGLVSAYFLDPNEEIANVIGYLGYIMKDMMALGLFKSLNSNGLNTDPPKLPYLLHLIQETELEDLVTFVFQDGEQTCSRGLLISSSDMFSTMLTGSFSESSKSRIELPTVSYRVFHTLISLISPPSIAVESSLQWEDVLALTELADQYLLPKVVAACLEWISYELSLSYHSQVSDILSGSRQISIPKISQIHVWMLRHSHLMSLSKHSRQSLLCFLLQL